MSDNIIMHFYDEVNIYNQDAIVDEVKECVKRYIKKSKPFYVMVSTKENDSGTVSK